VDPPAPSPARALPLPLLPAPGIDRKLFEVELVEDTINGGVVILRRDGMCVGLREYRECAWGSMGRAARG
jgi:hypothetical protein